MGSEKYNFPIDWDVKPLVQCTSNKNISYGIVQPGQHDETGIGIIRVNNFENGQINTKDALKVSFKIENKFEKTRLVGGEVLLTLVGSTGQSAVVPVSLQGWNVARAVAVIRPSAAISAEWIDICLKSPLSKQFLDDRANTTVQKTLNLKDVKEIPIPLPPLNERREIELIITNLDKKIAINRQINQTLEQMAQALFKSWFVDFDPVIDNVLDADNPIPDALAERAALRQMARTSDDFQPLPDDIRQLFPNEFEESELGWIPKGWEAGTLAKVSDVLSGFAFKSKDFAEEGAPVIKIKNINEDRTVDILDTQKVSFDIADNAKKFLLSDGDLIMAMTGATVGKFGLLVTEEGEEFYLNQRVAKFTAHDRRIGFTYCSLFRDEASNFVANSAQGSAQPNISAKGILALPLVVPKTILISYFNEKVTPLFNQMVFTRKQTFVLEKLRDTLLPKLISGELRLDSPEVEKAKSLAEAV